MHHPFQLFSCFQYPSPPPYCHNNILLQYSIRFTTIILPSSPTVNIVVCRRVPHYLLIGGVSVIIAFTSRFIAGPFQAFADPLLRFFFLPPSGVTRYGFATDDMSPLQSLLSRLRLTCHRYDAIRFSGTIIPLIVPARYRIGAPCCDVVTDHHVAHPSSSGRPA